MRDILLHGSRDEGFDRSVVFARRLAESFGARLHIVYTVEEPLGADWTAEVASERIPELHAAVEEEVSERLERIIPAEDQARLNIDLVLRTGPAEREVAQFTEERAIDLAILHAPPGNTKDIDLAKALIDKGKCAVLVLR